MFNSFYLEGKAIHMELSSIWCGTLGSEINGKNILTILGGVMISPQISD